MSEEPQHDPLDSQPCMRPVEQETIDDKFKG